MEEIKPGFLYSKESVILKWGSHCGGYITDASEQLSGHLVNFDTLYCTRTENVISILNLRV